MLAINLVIEKGKTYAIFELSNHSEENDLSGGTEPEAKWRTKHRDAQT
jgi:hypothetical protein